MCGQRGPALAVRSVELGDIFRAQGETYRQHHPISGQQARVMRAIELCRTDALGGYLERCDRCGVVTPRFRSCRNRHCPKCQTLDKARWLEHQQGQLLNTGYFHVVFTLPHELNPVAQGNPRVIYDLLFRASSETLLEFGRNPRWLGGELGITMVLHTWGQRLDQHLHTHCIVTAGALAPDGRWIAANKGFLFPIHALTKVFRAKYLDYLQQAYERGDLQFSGSVAALVEPGAFRLFVAKLKANDWMAYAKPPFASAEQVLAYLGRYTHRVAIANHRLVGFEDGQVRFRWRDYAHANKVKIMTLSADEFIRRFLLHVLPPNYCRIRHYGVLANRYKQAKLAACRAALNQPPPPPPPPNPESVPELMQRLTGIDIQQCPHCRHGRLEVIATLLPVRRQTTRLRPKATEPP